MYQFVVDHQVIVTLSLGAIWVAFIGALPAPTATSSAFYQFAFKFLNLLAAQFSRMNAAVEKSPNFQGAVDVQTRIAGLPKIDVKTQTDVK